MAGNSNPTVEVSRGDRQWLRGAVFSLVCGLVVGMVTWFADVNAPLETVFSNVGQTPYNLLAQAFSVGQLNLKREVPPELAKLSDPYNPNFNAAYLGSVNDLTYYKGKLYLYFGVTPALVFFWPYYALTGHFLSERDAVAFFMGIGFAAIAGILRAVRRHYYPETGSWIPAAGAIMTGTALALSLPVNFHEVPISCGFAFAMLALAAVWAALHEPGRRVLWLALASLAYGLAIGSRPSVLFGAAILFLPVFQAWGQPGEKAWRRLAVLSLAAAVPITTIGLGLMLYNFLRFNNPFEFGLHYQLSASARLPSAHLFSLNNFWFNTRLYFLDPVFLSRSFPFLKSAPLPPMPSGYDTGNFYAGGSILIIYPVVFFTVAAPGAWKRKVQGMSLGWFATACLLLFMAGAVTLTVYFASAVGYELEFLPVLLLLALIGAFCADHAALPFPGRRRLVCLGWFLLMSYSVAFNVLVNVEARSENVFLVGNYFLSQGRLDEAKAQYQKALASFPESADAHGGLGSLYFKEGHLDEAINEYQKALEISSDLVEVHNNLGRCLLHEGRVDEAIAQFEMIVQLRPGSVNYRNALGAAYAKKGLWDAATVQFEKSIEIEPTLAEAHNDLGYCFLQTGHLDEAIAENRIAVRLEPGSATYLDALANALCQKGSFDEAALEYKKALELRPHDAEACNNLGYCLQQTGRLDDAIVQYRAAIESQPGFAEAYFNLGNAYREKKMASQAANSYEKTIELAPQFVPAQMNLAWMLATWPDAGVRNGDKAVALATRLNDRAQSRDPEILRILAAACAETGKYAEATSTAKQALALAQAESRAELSADLQTEIHLYQTNTPCRSTRNF